MTKIFEMGAALLLVLFAVAIVNANSETCTVLQPSGKKLDYNSMESACEDVLMTQIQYEVDASLSYLGCATHFLDSQVNLPGVANVFLESASEEREHAKKLLEYLVMRGSDLKQDKLGLKLMQITKPAECSGTIAAFELAMKMEKNVTEHIKTVIRACDNVKDDNLVDYLSGDFLKEQYEGQKVIANRIVQLKKLTTGNGYALGEFIFDKKLIEGLF